MKAEIIGVGTELLLGQIANTNAVTISRALAEKGIDVLYHTVVGDNEERIATAITHALSRSDVLIMTGGLGPTQDDLTRDGLARATSHDLARVPELEQALRQRFERLGRNMAESNLRQVELPEGARAIPNARGTAPGIAMEHDGKKIYVLPGVPSEMEPMLYDFIIPELSAAAGGGIVLSRLLAVAGIPESEVAEVLKDEVARLDAERTATLAFLPSAGEVRIRITAKDANEAAALERIGPVEERIRKILGAAVFGVDDQSLEAVVASILIERGLTLAVAESVTGGMLASRLVDVPGASRFLRAGYVTYSMEAKADLGVPRSLLERHGAVSAETTLALAEAARLRAGVDLALATTGEAGPEPKEREVGTVFITLAWDGGSTHRGFRAPGERAAVRRWAANGALNLLRLHLISPAQGGPTPRQPPPKEARHPDTPLPKEARHPDTPLPKEARHPVTPPPPGGGPT